LLSIITQGKIIITTGRITKRTPYLDYLDFFRVSELQDRYPMRRDPNSAVIFLTKTIVEALVHGRYNG